jgi:negative regulator of flagellin synthesis FlgM
MDVTKTGPAALYEQFRTERPENAKTGAQAPARSAASVQGDTVTVSEEAMLRTEAYRVAAWAPDIRQEKIDALKAKVESGTYTIDPRRIAVNLLNSERDLLS